MNRITQAGDVVNLHLQNGSFAVIDAEDLERCLAHHWHLGDRYIFTHVYKDGKRTVMLLHRFVLGLQKGDKKLVDHINRNKLDCRKGNLRVCSPSENARNRSKAPKAARGASTSRYKGVSKKEHVTKTGRLSIRWRALIYVNGSKVSLGSYATEIEAAISYDKAAKRYFGEFAVLNFPNAETKVS